MFAKQAKVRFVFAINAQAFDVKVVDDSWAL
jgi:hypothetical protein